MDTSWGKVADWYHNLLTNDPDSYQVKVVLPNMLRLVEPKSGIVIADIACGEGFFSSAFAQAGATVIGADIGGELIEIAKKQKSPNSTFYVAPSHELSFIGSQSVDVVTIVLAVQNIEKYRETFVEVARTLKPGGRFIFVLNHPTYRIPKASSWGYDEEADIQYRRVDQYLSESKSEILMEPGKGEKSRVTYSFHRPLQAYSKALQKAGLAISRIEEWTSHKKSEEGKRQVAEDRSRKEIPLFMAVEAVKLVS